MNVTRKCISIIGISIIVCLVLFYSAPRTLSFETNEGTLFDVRGLMEEAELVYDDGNIKVFRIPLPLGDAESYEAAEPMALPKAKVLTAHVGPGDPTISLPWVPTFVDVYHHGWFEIRRSSDLVKVILSITGPEPAVFKTDWLGPLVPLSLYTYSLIDSYTAEGFYTLKVTVKPQRNKVYGASSEKSRFRALPSMP